VPIIGGGVMGLMTAYYAAPPAEAVTVLERSWVGDARCSIEYTTPRRPSRRAALADTEPWPGGGLGSVRKWPSTS
jgi:glycine/D-amino acid oxidase-like deaminating enzyme